MMKATVFNLLSIAILTAIPVFIIYKGVVKIEADRLICEAEGGVQVKTYDGFICLTGVNK